MKPLRAEPPLTLAPTKSEGAGHHLPKPGAVRFEFINNYEKLVEAPGIEPAKACSLSARKPLISINSARFPFD